MAVMPPTATALWLWTALAGAAAGPAPDTEPAPVAVFAALEGGWAGTFVGLDPEGRELYRIEVRQTYRTVDRETQQVVIEDRMADGTVIRGRGRNVANRAADGSLRLSCVVEKSNGDRVEHRGRLVRAADGQEALVWWSVSAGRSETFLESVRGRGPDAVYSIEGMGRYGDRLILMSGRYRRLED
jgi:hypothetical protein